MRDCGRSPLVYSLDGVQRRWPKIMRDDLAAGAHKKVKAMPSGIWGDDQEKTALQPGLGWRGGGSVRKPGVRKNNQIKEARE